MKEKENIPKISGFKTPEGYFDESFGRIKDRVEFEKVIPHRSGNVGFEVPHDYFESNNTILKDRIALEQAIKGTTREGFEIPEGYFENINLNRSALWQKLNTSPSTKEIKVVPLKRYLYPAIAIAASFLLLFTVLITQNSSKGIESVEMASITEYFDMHDSTFYETDIEELLTEEDLQSLESDVALEETLLIDYLEDRTDSYDLYMQ